MVTNNGNATNAVHGGLSGSVHTIELDTLASDVARLRDALGALPPPRERPALVLLVGAPGSGKTTIARAVHERTPVMIIDADEIRRDLFDVPDYSFRESQHVDRAIRRLIDELLEAHQTVVLDDSNLTEWERQPLYTLAERHEVPLVIVEVTAPPRIVLERIRHLAVHSPNDAEAIASHYSRMAGRQEPIARPHLRVDTSLDVRPAVEEVVRAIDIG